MPGREELLEIRFSGDMRPENIHSKELAGIISSFEEMVAKLITEEESEVSSSEVVVSLVEVKEGSTSLRFRSSFMSTALGVYVAFANAVKERRYDEINPSVAKDLQEIHKFSRQHNCQTEFWVGDEELEPIARLSPEEEVEVRRPARVTGLTTLYGTLERVGGAKPKIVIRVGGDRISCEADTSLARQVADRLYEEIGLRGEAVWNADDYSLEEFRVTEILPFEGGEVTEAFEELSSIASEAYRDVDDVVGYVAKLRGNEEEGING